MNTFICRNAEKAKKMKKKENRQTFVYMQIQYTMHTITLVILSFLSCTYSFILFSILTYGCPSADLNEAIALSSTVSWQTNRLSNPTILAGDRKDN